MKNRHHHHCRYPRRRCACFTARTVRGVTVPVLLMILIGMLAGLPAPAWAQQEEPAEVSQEPKEVTALPPRPQARYAPELVIDGTVVMRLRARAGGLTPQERAQSLRERLGRILTLPNLKAEDVSVAQRRRGQTAYIYVRQRLLITVDRNLAEANNSTPASLANVWAENLRRTLPRINVTVR